MRLTKSLSTFFENKKFFILGLSIFLTTLIAVHELENYFVLTKVLVESPTKERVELRGITALVGSNLLTLKDSDIQKIILKSNPVLKSVDVVKVFPDQLLVKVVTRTPLMYLEVQNGYFLLDEEAVILKKEDEVSRKNIPVATYYQQISKSLYTTGERLANKDIADTLFFLSTLRSIRISVNSIDIAGFDMLGLYTSEEKFVFSSEKDIELQAYQLSESVRTFRLTGKKFKSLDLRFEKPVVTF